MPEGGHRVEAHPHGGEQDEADGEEGDVAGEAGLVGLLKGVPEYLLVHRQLAGSEVLDFILKVEKLDIPTVDNQPGLHLAGVLVSLLLPAGVLDELFSGRVLGLTASLQPDAVDAPVLEVLAVIQHTDLLHDVKTTSPVEVEDAAKYSRMPALSNNVSRAWRSMPDLSKKNWLSWRL